MRESMGVNRPKRRSESESCVCDPVSLAGAGAARSRLFWRRLSVHVGTRKMVNYARAS